MACPEPARDLDPSHLLRTCCEPGTLNFCARARRSSILGPGREQCRLFSARGAFFTSEKSWGSNVKLIDSLQLDAVPRNLVAQQARRSHPKTSCASHSESTTARNRALARPDSVPFPPACYRAGSHRRRRRRESVQALLPRRPPPTCPK